MYQNTTVSATSDHFKELKASWAESEFRPGLRPRQEPEEGGPGARQLRPRSLGSPRPARPLFRAHSSSGPLAARPRASGPGAAPKSTQQTLANSSARRKRAARSCRSAGREQAPAARPSPRRVAPTKGGPGTKAALPSARSSTYPASSSFLLALIWSPSAPFWLPVWGAALPPPAPAATPVPVPAGDSPSGAASCPFSVAPVVSMGCSSPASDILGRGARLLQRAATARQAGATPAQAPARGPGRSPRRR